MYEIKILSNKQFDDLPQEITRGSDISDSLGFANPFIKKAFVRETGVHELNKFLVNHELEELMASSSTHEDSNGIRHKKFFKEFVMPILTAGLSSALGGAIGGGPGGGSDFGLGSLLVSSLTNKRNLQQPQQQQQQTFQPPSSGSYAPSAPRSVGSSQSGPLSGSYAPSQLSGVSGMSSLPASVGGSGATTGSSLSNLNLLSNFHPEQMYGYYGGGAGVNNIAQPQELRF